MNKTKTPKPSISHGMKSPLLHTHRENPNVSLMQRYLLLTTFHLSHGEGHKKAAYLNIIGDLKTVSFLLTSNSVTSLSSTFLDKTHTECI